MKEFEIRISASQVIFKSRKIVGSEIRNKNGSFKMKKVPTGVKGLDGMLGGGLPLGRCVLVCGGPGSGKTIFGIQFLYNGAVKHDNPRF